MLTGKAILLNGLLQAANRRLRIRLGTGRLGAKVDEVEA